MLTNKKTKLNGFILLMIVAIAGTAAGQTIYVDAGATGTNDGASWADAYLSLQDALTAVAGGGTILVAEGTYKPDQGGGQTPGDRYATFQLISGVAIYGGFPSGGGAWDDRDPVAYQTILSGDLDADDVQVDLIDLLTEPTRQENSCHVVTAEGTDNTTTLDGFTVSGGNANIGTGDVKDAMGGGMYNYESSPTLINCTFSGNSALQTSGAIHCYYSFSVITNCTFTGNKAGVSGASGGAVGCDYSSPTITNCTISGNRAGYGGGLMLHFGSHPTITNCRISGNYAGYGGGVYCKSGCDPIIANCTISGNLGYRGSGIRCRSDSDPVITNTIFEGNTVSQAIYEEDIDSDPTVAYCLFHNNPNGDYYDSDTAASYTGAEAINTNVAEASNNIDGDPMFVEPGYGDGPVDGLVWVDGDYHLLLGSPCIDAGDNTAVPALVVTDLDGNPRFDDCPDIPDTGNGMAPIVDIGAYEVIAPVIQVAIDIKPGSYPNSINLGSYGLIPVAILSSEDFDATTVDAESVELAGAGVAVRGKSNKYMAHQQDVNEDGLVDLLVQVATENLDPDSFQDGFAVLTGNLLEEFGGTLIEGTDEITIVPPVE